MRSPPPPKIRIRVQEGKRFELPHTHNSSTARDRLLRTTAGMSFNVFTVDGRGFRAGNVVGVIDTGSLQVEILPKVAAGSGLDDDARFLMDLLSMSGLTPRLMARAGRVSLTSHSTIEAVIRLFAANLAWRLSSGAPRRYSERTETSSVLRGGLDFARMATRPPGSDHVLAIRHAPLQMDNPLSQLILAVVNVLLAVTRSVRNRAMLQHCASLLDQVSTVSFSEDTVRRVALTRFESEWLDVVELARALIRGQTPSPVSAGLTPSFTMLFPLDDLFERSLRRSLFAALTGETISISSSPRNPHFLRTEEGRDILRLRPDYLFVQAAAEDEKVMVGDAKWKRLAEGGRSFGLRPPDVYQLTTYMARHQLQRGILFFPMDAWMRSNGAYWRRSFSVIGTDSRINVVGVDVPGLVTRDRERRQKALAGLRQVVLDCVA